VDYPNVLNNLTPALRERLRAVARVAEMTELEALTLIVKFSNDLIRSDESLSRINGRS